MASPVNPMRTTAVTANTIDRNPRSRELVRYRLHILFCTFPFKSGVASHRTFRPRPRSLRNESSELPELLCGLELASYKQIGYFRKPTRKFHWFFLVPAGGVSYN